MSIIETLEETQIARARECFNLYARDGSLPRGQLPRVLRSLGVNPTMDEIEEMAGDKDAVDFPDLLELMAKTPSKADAKAEVLKAFKAHDVAGSGTMSQAEFRGIMKTLGEGLSDAEINALISKSGGGDQIKYAEFVEKVFA